jgi:hypothetical protein
MIDEYGGFGGMRIGRENRSTGRKPAPASLYPTQVPRDLIWDRTRVAAVETRKLIACAMVRPEENSWLRPKLKAGGSVPIQHR